MADMGGQLQSLFLSCLYHAVDHCAGLGSTRRISEQPVFPSNHERLYRALAAIIANFQAVILHERRQFVPLV
jgi:hypothetical protein